MKNKDAFQVLEQVFLHVSVSVAGSTVHGCDGAEYTRLKKSLLNLPSRLVL